MFSRLKEIFKGQKRKLFLTRKELMAEYLGTKDEMSGKCKIGGEQYEISVKIILEILAKAGITKYSELSLEKYKEIIFKDFVFDSKGNCYELIK